MSKAEKGYLSEFLCAVGRTVKQCKLFIWRRSYDFKSWVSIFTFIEL